MENWLKPEDLQHSFDVEPLFDQFVQSTGGELIKNLIPHSPNFENADYIFRTENVLAELKCLQADFALPKAIQQKVHNLYRKWIGEGSITFEMIFRPRELPRDKRRKLQRLYSEPIRRVIKKANRQLRTTAEKFSMPDAQKLLLLANDGLYSIESLPIISITASILQREFSSIQGFVYFTVNSYIEIPGDDYARQIWVSLYDDSASDDLVAFVDRLGEQWFHFFGAKIGGWDTGLEQTQDRSIIDGARFIRVNSPKA